MTLLTNQQPVPSGYLLNVELSETGHSYITEDYFSSIGGTKKQNVELQSGAYVENAEGQMVETNYAVMTQLAGIIPAESMDFLHSGNENCIFCALKILEKSNMMGSEKERESFNTSSKFSAI